MGRNALIRIIENKRISTLYQPILNKSLEIIGYEALSRITLGDFNIEEIFEIATKQSLNEELDLCCFEMSLKNRVHKEKELFINLNTNTLLKVENNKLENLLKGFKNITIELNENQKANKKELGNKVKFLRDLEIKVAIDDLAKGHQRIEHWLFLEPNYVKLDREIIKNCHLEENYRNKVMLKGLINLANGLKTGIVFEGVEIEEELACIMNILNNNKLDVKTYFQGYLFKQMLLQPVA